MHHLIDDVMSDAPHYQEAWDRVDVPAALADQYHHPPKEEAIAQHTSRFGNM